MFVDYNYYINDFHGTLLDQNNFEKYAFKACSYITNETMSRIIDSTINSYPKPLVDDIKMCACDLAEIFHDKDKIYRNAINISSEKNNNITSERAGEVSVSYGSSDSLISKFSDPKYFNNYLRETVKSWLYPRVINGIVYNITSKIINNCKFCNII